MSTETDLLHEAAALMRERAEVAAHGPWTTVLDQVYAVHGPATWILSGGIDEARHAASWHPGVALAVADWLEHVVARSQTRISLGGKPGPVWSHERDALAVARAYLGRES